MLQNKHTELSWLNCKTKSIECILYFNKDVFKNRWLKAECFVYKSPCTVGKNIAPIAIILIVQSVLMSSIA